MANEPETSQDSELKAIEVVVAALKPLGEEERRRVLEYVLGRFGVMQTRPANPPPGSDQFGIGNVPTPPHALTSPAAVLDIRSLKEAKAPRSANEMAALVAYYVS